MTAPRSETYQAMPAWLRVLLTSALVVETGCAIMPPCPGRGGPAWRQLSSAHFTLRTDLEPHEAEEVVRSLEETRAAMLVAIWPGAPGPPDRTQAIALASHSELAVFTGFGVGGMHVHTPPFPPTLVIGAGDLEGESLKHELAHDLSRWFLPIQPAWYSEGIATFLEAVRYDRAKERVIVGEPSSKRLQAIQHTGVVLMEQLLGPMPDDVFELGRFESSSWILMHYLVNHRTYAFEDFQRRLGRLEPAMKAWQAEFPDLGGDNLYRTLVEYARSGSYVVRRIPLAPWSGSTEARVLSDAEAHGVLAYLYAYVHLPGAPGKPVAARAEIDEALRGDPSALDALAVAFYTPELRIETSRPELARRAVGAHPESWLAWQMVADSTRPSDPAKLTALIRALEVAPRQPEVLTRLAALKASSGKWDDALSFSAKAMRAGAVRPDVWMIHLAALANSAHCAEAALWAAAVTGYLPPDRARAVVKAWEGLRPVCASRNALSPAHADAPTRVPMAPP